MLRRFLLVVVAASIAAETAHAQVFLQPTTRATRGTWSVDIAGQVAQPIGGFRSNVDVAWGFGTAIRHNFSWFTPLALRGDFGFLNYGNERKRVPLSQTVNRVLVDMNTTNNIALVTFGPELSIPRGPIRPYVYGFAGFSYFFTESSVGDDNDGGSFARTTNFDDGGLSTGFGGGLRIPINLRRAYVAIDGGARRTYNGTRNYLRRGDIRDQPDGSLLFNARTTEADFWQFHLGASIGSRSRR